MSQKYGGKLIDDYSAMRGLAPEGFHVPLTTEWQAVYNVWTALGGGSSDGTNFGIALKLPFAGRRKYLDSSVSDQGTRGRYWSSSRNNPTNAYYLYLTSTIITPQSFAYRSDGFSVRCFKDSPIIPTSSWIKLYGTSIESGGIFWNSVDGLISLSSDGQTWITISDKNLGATTVWNSGDTVNEANCGGYFQWGNNYMFPFTGTIANQSTTQVNASNYGPGNYYSSDTFIIYNGSWDSSDNGNLRGGETGVQQKPANIIKKYYGGKTIVNYEDMQGPCPTGFHISTSKDWTRAMNIGISLGAWDSTGDHMSIYLKIPPTGLRTNQSDFYGDGEMSVYLTPEITDDEDAPGWYYPKAFQFVFNEQYSLPNEASLGGANICDGCSIRPFKNVSVVPDNNWTVLYQGSGSAGIFHDETSGLISLSSDGENRITLADKNLGATEVYNYGDTLSHSNCGKLYQWGNNFGFLWQGNLLTTGTKVDGSLYGPGNYYSFNEYYIEVGDMTDRSSVRNDNRRGGVTGAERLAKVKKVYYGGKLIDDYSAMRGPCPEGFHVPLESERQAIRTMWTDLGTSMEFVTAFKIPKAGRLYSTSGGFNNYSAAFFRSCKASGDNYQARQFWASTGTPTISSAVRSYGYSIRPFKDTPVVPDSNRDTIYAGTGDAGIFHNSTLGLISVSSDGISWVTIADKNLGATTVYTGGDYNNENNCGGFFQWGNNYMFPRSGATNTSATQVNATGYGPGNYYNSSTFITSDGAWDTSDNRNLRGGVTGVQQRPILIREDNS